MNISHDCPLLFVQGFMEYSYLFYGYYNNTTVEDRNFSYNIPLAYLFTAVFYFVFCLICIIARSVIEQIVSILTTKNTCVCVFSHQWGVQWGEINRLTNRSRIREFSHFDLHPLLCLALAVKHGDCSSSCRGNGRRRCGQLQRDIVHQLGLRLPGRPSYQTEAEEHPLPTAGQTGSVPLSRMKESQENCFTVWRKCRSAVIPCIILSLSYSLSGGSGGGEQKEKDSGSDFGAKTYFILPTCFHVFGVIGAHCGSLLRHLQGHRLQPGTFLEKMFMGFTVWKSSVTFLFPICDTQTKSGVKGILGLVYEYLPSIVITIANFLVPLLGDQIARVERYSPSNTVIVALLRFAI